VWSQPDTYAAWPEPRATDLAVAGLTQEELWSAAAAGTQLTGGGRLLSVANPASPSGLASFTEPLSGSGSLVLVTHASAVRCDRIAVDERVTDRFDPPQPARS
ncbi:MAG: TIGR03089 family protein, partial [Nocardioides sp.]